MRNETILLLTPVENFSDHDLAKYAHMYEYLLVPVRFDKYFYEPLKSIFSRVILYDYVKRMIEVGVKNVNKEIIEIVRRDRPKYVLWNAMYWYGIRESTFIAVRKEGAIVVGWFLDDEVPEIGFDNYSKWWTPYIDYFVTNSIEAEAKYKALNAKCLLEVSILGGEPVERNWSDIKERHEVSFVGRKLLDREQYINEIRKRNIPVDVFGREWPNGKHIPFENMIEIFATSKINLNFSKVWGDKKQIKGRIFEICLSDGFLLSEYVSGIERCFDIDKEIVCFNNSEEMIDKIIYYLSHDNERRAIAQAGWEKAINNYTSFHVLSRVFNEIEEDIVKKGKEGKTPVLKSKMPREIRKRFSDYYYNWGAALSEENYKGLWQDALALSIRYYPFDMRAWYHFIISFLPYSVRTTIIRLCRALYHRLSSNPNLMKLSERLKGVKRVKKGQI